MKDSDTGRGERSRWGVLAGTFSCIFAGLFTGVFAVGVSGVILGLLDFSGAEDAWMAVSFSIGLVAGALIAWILRDRRWAHAAMKIAGLCIALLALPVAVWEYFRSLEVSGWAGLGHSVAAVLLCVAFVAGLCLLCAGSLAGYRVRAGASARRIT